MWCTKSFKENDLWKWRVMKRIRSLNSLSCSVSFTAFFWLIILHYIHSVWKCKCGSAIIYGLLVLLRHCKSFNFQQRYSIHTLFLALLVFAPTTKGFISWPPDWQLMYQRYSWCRVISITYLYRIPWNISIYLLSRGVE